MSNRQKFSLKLDDHVLEGRRQFFLDARPAHGISQDLLDEALTQARMGIWRHDPQAGLDLGRTLFQLMDGSGGALSSELQKCNRHEPCAFSITLPTDLNALPVGLLADKSGFLQLHRKLNIYRAEMDRSSSWDPLDRPLKMLLKKSWITKRQKRRLLASLLPWTTISWHVCSKPFSHKRKSLSTWKKRNKTGLPQ